MVRVMTYNQRGDKQLPETNGDQDMKRYME